MNLLFIFRWMNTKSKLLDFIPTNRDASLELEHSESNTDFMDGHYLPLVKKIQQRKQSKTIV